MSTSDPSYSLKWKKIVEQQQQQQIEQNFFQLDSFL